MDGKALVKKEKKKYNKHMDPHKLYIYNKKQIYNYIKENGTSQNACMELEEIIKINPKEISEFLNNISEQAQETVHEEINTPVFDNLEAFIKDFEENGYNESCKYEIPMIMKLIAETESHPDTSNNGIDFASLYNYLSDIMRGNVPKELNDATEEFLMETFEDLLNVTNCEDDKNKSEIDEINASMANKTKRKMFKSLDPLNLNTLNVIS